jgi:putative DNA primase/helicase
MGRLSGRRIYGSAFEFDPQFKLFIDANHRPRISGTEDAIWYRLKMIPFTVSIPKDQQDKHLLEKLVAEAPGILAWAVQGCLRWQHDGGLGAPEAVTHATEGYRNEMDPVTDFIADCCIEGPDAIESSSDLLQAYLSWCKNNRENPVSQTAFGTALTRRGVDGVRSSGVRCRKGLALRRGPLAIPAVTMQPTAYLQ